MIINPSAETGDTTGWTKEGMGDLTVVAGGTEGDFCFYLTTGGNIGFRTNMLQTFTGLQQPPDIKVGCDFLPENEPVDNRVRSQMTVLLTYADGTVDEVTVPLRRDV